MAQKVLPFQYEVEKKAGGMTALAGLPLYLEFAHLMGLPRLISDHVRARQGDQGWRDGQMIMALVLLNLAGGDCVDGSFWLHWSGRMELNRRRLHPEFKRNNVSDCTTQVKGLRTDATATPLVCRLPFFLAAGATNAAFCGPLLA